jgi:putative nucleotidyltransferase with HDIG domain
MTVPGRVDAAALLLSLDPQPWALRHALAVAEVAGWLAGRAAGRGHTVDRRLVETAALLHDVDKLLPAGEAARKLRHGDGSAAWLTNHGHEELGPVVADHPVTRLVDGPAFEAWLHRASLAARIVAYADKRAGQRLEPMRARFASWASRYPDSPGWDAEIRKAVSERALHLEADVCEHAGIAPDEVRRLPWTGPALRAARARP